MGNASHEVQQERDHQHFENLFSLGASDGHGLSWRRGKAKRLAVKCGGEVEVEGTGKLFEVLNRYDEAK